jgi:cellulose biosynthesis protein BcsQ
MSERSPRTLYSWIDVQLALEESRARGCWPNWLKAASVYFDSVLLRVVQHTERSDVREFLGDIFGARFEPESQTILLESAPDQIRSMAVEIEDSEDSPTGGRPPGLEPFFRRLAILPTSPSGVVLPTPLPPGPPDIVAFYSFKGGVGRTTHLLALLQCLGTSAKPTRALVIDADLEAPGITSLLDAEKSFSPASFSFADLLALAQSDTSDDFSDTLRVATHAIRRQTLDLTPSGMSVSHYVLPAYRSQSQAIRLDVRPEHLVARPGRSWVLAELVADLGKRLDVGLVLIDLRAGFSELASPFLFDPRFHRIIVTTPSRQSLDGTKVVLRQLAKIPIPADREDLRDPTVIVSFVLPELLTGDLIKDTTDGLLETYPEGEIDVDLAKLRIEYTTFAQELLYLPSISDAVERLSGSTMCRVMGQIADEVVARRHPDWAGTPTQGVETVRDSLCSLAKRLEYAESGEGNQFLKTAPLRALAQQSTGTVPIAVVMGSKGAGKTYTYLQIARSKIWSEFVLQALGSVSQDRSLIWPLLASMNLERSALGAVNELRRATGELLGVQNPLASTAISDLINESLRHAAADETWWRHRWFTIFARSLGLSSGADNEAASRLVEMLRRRNQRVVLLIDGLEDLFRELEKNPAQRTALRALLQGVPNHLRELPDQSLGILIFVRGDLARAAISQNFGQFFHRYESFALIWNEEEALRLAVWMADAAGLSTQGRMPERMTVDDAKSFLYSLWGRKLGSDDSREARSAEWVIAALSDFLGQIQARDLVRFLRHAAAYSQNAKLTDRILAPRAVRDAIAPCSEEKIKEIEQEIPRLKSIFAKLQSSAGIRIPFDAASSGLTSEEIGFLATVGALTEDKGEYFMPEIFRRGLGFQLAEGKRPRVLGLARQRIGARQGLFPF